MGNITLEKLIDDLLKEVPINVEVDVKIRIKKTRNGFVVTERFIEAPYKIESLK